MAKPKKKKKSSTKSKSNLAPLNMRSIRRSQETMLIDAKNVHSPEWSAGIDPIFEKLYIRYLRGQISGFMTRMPMEMIKEGFYHPSRNLEYLCDAPPEEYIQESMQAIRQGHRPPLHLYANPNRDDDVRFLCPDDVVSCRAYKRLNFGSVPVIVFGPGRQSLPFSSFESKASVAASDQGIRIRGLISRETPSKLPTIFGETLPSDPVEGLKALANQVNVVISRLQNFHLSREGQLHYHHMLFSALIRVQETLKAIEILIEQNLWYQALALLRVLYEIHLNFYFDWLQPETNYQFLMAASIFNISGVVHQKRKMIQELVSKGHTQRNAEERAENAWRPVSLASTVSEKARLPKVSILYHKGIYDFLSRISHQTFDVASIHANRFDDDSFLAIEDDVKETYLRFMDFIVSEFVQCVDQDIGTP